MRINRLLVCAAAIVVLATPSLAQERFDSADAAAQALIDSAEKHDTARLTAMLGPGGASILTSGSVDQDRAEQSEFAQLARNKHRLMPDGRNPNREILFIGDEDWPFPVPIVRRNGKWSFDASETRVEMDARRIGTNELDAIEICAGYVQAQRAYASEDRDKDGVLKYALHVKSGAARRDGLFWENDANPLVPRGLADATWDGPAKPVKPYHGYYFRILDAQGPNAPGGAHTYRVKDKLFGGFALVAWPAKYGVTGVHTFIVNQDGIVYQKDIAAGPAGEVIPARYDPDPSWTPAE